MSLARYRKMRNFAHTREATGKARAKRGYSYVIQKHRASHMHYDFRLELNGVLLSWAVPKGPSLDPSVRRLAMQTGDHPIEYGAGTGLLWDRGTWQPRESGEADYGKGRLKFVLDGEKLHGGWMLVRGGKG